MAISQKSSRGAARMAISLVSRRNRTGSVRRFRCDGVPDANRKVRGPNPFQGFLATHYWFPSMEGLTFFFFSGGDKRSWVHIRLASISWSLRRTRNWLKVATLEVGILQVCMIGVLDTAAPINEKHGAPICCSTYSATTPGAIWHDFRFSPPPATVLLMA